MNSYRYAFAVLVMLAAVTPAASQTAFSDEPTDTIEVDGQTVIGAACTHEAVVLFPGDVGAGGLLYNELTNAQEDKQLFVAFAGSAASRTPSPWRRTPGTTWRSCTTGPRSGSTSTASSSPPAP